MPPPSTPFERRSELTARYVADERSCRIGRYILIGVAIPLLLFVSSRYGTIAAVMLSAVLVFVIYLIRRRCRSSLRSLQAQIYNLD